MACRRNRRDVGLAARIRELEADNRHLRDCLVDAIERNANLNAALNELEALRG